MNSKYMNANKITVERGEREWEERNRREREREGRIERQRERETS